MLFKNKIITCLSVLTMLVVGVVIFFIINNLRIKDSNNKISNTDNCNVSFIQIDGDLVSDYSSGDYNKDGSIVGNVISSKDLYLKLSEIKNQNNIKAIWLEINSDGGSYYAGEEIYRILKSIDKLKVAQIRESGLSAAYYLSLGADKIYALNSSYVGSIGVTQSFFDESKKNLSDGYVYNQLNVGKYKEALNHNKPLTLDERKIIMNNLNVLYDDFVSTVAKNRKINIDKVIDLADGYFVLGSNALKNGLIDNIGDYDDVAEYIKNTIKEDIKLCK